MNLRWADQGGRMSFPTDSAIAPGVEVPALRKGLLVLELLAEHGSLTMAEIQKLGQFNKTMTFRLLRALGEHGYVEHDEVSHRYSLSLRVLELSGAVTTRFDLVSVSQAILDDLRSEFEETINLGVLRDDHILYVGIAESSQPGLLMASYVGNRNHLHSTAIGKVILAFLPEHQQQAILTGYPLPRFTPHTITELDALREDLVRARSQGYAVDNEENEVGARCIGVPILDSQGHPLAGLSVSGPRSRIGDEATAQMAERLWVASHEISRRLGHARHHPAGGGVDAGEQRRKAVFNPAADHP